MVGGLWKPRFWTPGEGRNPSGEREAPTAELDSAAQVSAVEEGQPDRSLVPLSQLYERQVVTVQRVRSHCHVRT